MKPKKKIEEIYQTPKSMKSENS